MILKLKNQLIKIDVSAERADERRSTGLDGVLIEDAEQADRAAQKDAQLIRALCPKNMNQCSKISDGLAGWLTFELRCGRKELFRESLIAQPLHQLLLNHRFPGRVICEVNHPVLSPLAKGPGRKPSIDFAVTGENNRYSAVIETKWVSKSQTILRDLIRDIVRLDLLVPSIADEGFIILAGNKRDI